MPRPFDHRSSGPPGGGPGTSPYRMLASAVVLQLLAALLVLLVAPGGATTSSGLRPTGTLDRATVSGADTATDRREPAPTDGEPEPAPVQPDAAKVPPPATTGAALPGLPKAPGEQPAGPAGAGSPLLLPPQDSAGRVAARTAAVRELLARRSAAVLDRDETAFLAEVDPAATALRARQAALFAALEPVPLSTWTYVLDPTVEQPADPRLDAAYGAGRWWAPRVLLETALAGVDDRPTVTVQHLTFVERDGRWLLAADDDFAAAGQVTQRALWDQGPVVAEQVDEVLVLGRPEDRPLLREVAATTAAAVPRVTAAWGDDWRRGVVVLVPGSGAELAELFGSQDDLGAIAGLAIAELGDAERGEGPTGERILLHPEVFTGLSPTGRRLVLTHELTHVATRRATGPAVPIWLAEGYADHVGYSGLSLSVSVTAVALQADVRAGRLPERLPVDADFGPENPALAQAYEQAWLVVELIAEQHGEDGLLRFYRAVGRDPGTDPAAAVERALRSELGTTTAELTADWRAALQRDLG